MVVAINDLSFMEKFKSKAEAIEGIRRWMEVCRKLESEGATAVNALYAGPVDSNMEIVPGFRLIQFVKELKSKDERNYLLHLLMNLNTPPQSELPSIPFSFRGKDSYICAWVDDGIVVSILTDSGYGTETLEGANGSDSFYLKNISSDSHIDFYKQLLGIRCYEPNKKHRKEAYLDTAGRYVEAMDLSREDAQRLLNRAIEIDGKLYGKKRGIYYCFQRHHDNCYHGYQNHGLPLHICNQIDKRQWE